MNETQPSTEEQGMPQVLPNKIKVGFALLQMGGFHLGLVQITSSSLFREITSRNCIQDPTGTSSGTSEEVCFHVSLGLEIDLGEGGSNLEHPSPVHLLPVGLSAAPLASLRCVCLCPSVHPSTHLSIHPLCLRGPAQSCMAPPALHHSWMWDY